MIRSAMVATLPLVFIMFTSPTWVSARPVPDEPPNPALQPVTTWTPLDTWSQERAAAGTFGAAQAGTTYFGGTTWAADSMRWEAMINSVWTFDSGVGSSFSPDVPGVNPYKLPGLHTLMEGWIGIDRTFGDEGEFRRLSMSDFPFDVCVGDSAFGAGVGGNYSLWAGLLPSEAEESCYVGGQGYGDNWNVCVFQNFAYTGGGVTLEFDFVNETEFGFDFTRVYIDTSGFVDGTGNVETIHFTGSTSAHESYSLIPGFDLPSSPRDIRISFCVESDVAWSDEDGINATRCGAFTLDNISVTGTGLSHFADFETSEDGWALLPPEPGPGGDWTDIVHRDDLPPYLTECPCNLQDSVLVLQDLAVGGHGVYQNNFAASPWIDLKRHGLVGIPELWIEGDIYMELPVRNYIWQAVLTQYYPAVNPNGCLGTSGWFSASGPGPDVPTCMTGRAGLGIPLSAERFRVGVGIINFCRFTPLCTGVTNSTPWYDNLRVGVAGDPEAPLIWLNNYTSWPMDNFPATGGLRPSAPGRMDGSYWQGSSLVGSTSPNDVLAIGVKGQDVEARVQFAVEPGPAIDLPRFTAWLTGHAFEGTHNGLDWYSARMDTAKKGPNWEPGGFVTRYHEEDPNFSGTDTDVDPYDIDPTWDIDPYRAQIRYANDMFPDDLFTPGTRINLFYKTRFTGSTTWFTAPDTSGGNTIEYEVMPSSMAADSTFNCVLYVNRYSDKSRWEAALSGIIPSAPGNFESTGYDRYDVIAPNYGNGFGRPLNFPNGATVTQALGYRTILWGGGGDALVRMRKWDAETLIPWLTLLDFPDNNLYLAGDNIGTLMTEAGFAQRRLLSDLCGVSVTCDTFRDLGCPTGTPQDYTDCVGLDPVSGAQVADPLRSGDQLGQGNGCPDQASFDVLSPNLEANFGIPRGDEEYVGSAKTAQYASVSNRAEEFGPLSYRTVVDGISPESRRDPGACDVDAPPSSASESRLREVLEFFGYSEGGACVDPTAGTGIDMNPVQTYVTSLANFSPNPLMSGSDGKIRFTLAREGYARIDIFDINGRKVRTVFDGTATQGPNEAVWNGTDDLSRTVAGGVYFYRLRTSDQEFTSKLVVVRGGR